MSAPLEVFCCYAREDQEMLAHLKKHLAPLERQNQITIWSDTNLNAGVEWEKELHQHLESADIILLLISPDFMASDYCYSTEMGWAIARHNEGSAVVIPLLLRSTFWQNAPFAKLQIVPTNTKPVTSWPDRDDALHDITMQVNQVVSQWHVKRVPIEADETAHTREQPSTNQKTPPASQNLLAASTQVQPMLIPPLSKMGSPQSIASPPRTLAAKPEAMELLRTLTGHTHSVTSVAWSADGRTLASGSGDQTIKLWNVQTGQLLRTLAGHTNFVRSVAWSADGQVLASGSNDQTIKLWSVQTGQLLRTLLTDPSYVSSVALSADGLTLASGSGDQTIKLWNVQTGKLLHTLTGHTDAVYSVTWSADGQMLASGSHDQTIKLWNVQTGQLLCTLTGHTHAVPSMAWSADGRTLASGSSDQTIKLWNVQTSQSLRTLTGHTSYVYSVAWSADGFTLASGSSDQTIKIWGVKE